MSKVQFTHVSAGDGFSVVTAFVPGRKPVVALSDHPNFDRILDGLLNDDPSVFDLFDVSQTVASKFEKLSDRVSIGDDRLVYFDGDVVDNSLVDQIVRFLDQGVEDWKPLVAFFEKVQDNPNEHSRTQLYDWLSRRDFSITENGDIVGYKGVSYDGNSVHSGKAIVDGVVHNGRIPNKVGSVIEMPRSEVQHDPSVGCHTGLHVGTYEYASSFGNKVLEIHVNPRDVVSVPTDCDWAKVRCCRYVVVGEIAQKYSLAVVPTYDFRVYDDPGWSDGDDNDVCEDCGDTDPYDYCDGSCGY